MKITYVTGNAGKFSHAQFVLKDWELTQVALDLPEIQGSSAEIAGAKARAAVDQLKIPLVVEDVSIRCAALNGLPGPYVKDFLKHLGVEGLCELVHKYNDHNAEALCTVAYIEPGKEAVLFEGRVQGSIVHPKGGLEFNKYSWNPIFLKVDESRTFAEMTKEEFSAVSPRTLALKQLEQYLHTQNTSQQ